MLQGIRDNSQGIVAKIIVGLIAVTFALFGVESLVSLSAGSNAPATVNGEEISERDLYQATQLQRRSILAQMGENADPAALDDNLLRGMVLDSLIEQKALLVNAADNAMLISDAMVDQIIVQTPEFLVDGVFQSDRFDTLIRNAGFTRQTYRESVKKNQLLQQQRAGYALSSYVLPSNVNNVMGLDRQTRNIRYFALPLATVSASISVSDADVEAAFEAQKNDLNTQEQVVVDYIELKQSDLLASATVTDEQINTEYDQLVASFESQEQRQAAHIMVEITDDVSSADALAKIEKIKLRLDSGESFSDLAAQASDDVGTAQSGGDLGIQTRGTFDPDFEAALYSLAQGEVSAPVEGESGYHLIKVTNIVKTEAPSLADSKAEIIAKLKQTAAETAYLEKLERLTDISFSSADLQEPAAELALNIQTSKAFSRDQGEGIFTNTKIVREAFTDDLIKDGLNSAPIELDRETAVVLNVREHLPVRPKTLAEVSDQLKAELLIKKSSEQLKLRAETAIKEIRATGDASVVSTGFELKSQLNATRSMADVPTAVLVKAFEMSHPQGDTPTVSTTTLPDNSLVIVILDQVNKADLSKVTPEEVEAVGTVLSERLGNKTYDVFVNQVKALAEVEKL